MCFRFASRFQPTPAHGGRHQWYQRGQHIRKGFNPRPRTAGDYGEAAIRGLYFTGFNPRPRTAGDQQLAFPHSCCKSKFQPTPAHGGRPVAARYVHQRARGRFQPTPAHGGRLLLDFLNKGKYKGFNPRPRTAGDGPGIRWYSMSSLFQPTPAHGGRPVAQCESRRELEVSTHARARRATGRWRGGDYSMSVSTHARARRATFPKTQVAYATGAFQPTPAHGGRPHHNP